MVVYTVGVSNVAHKFSVADPKHLAGLRSIAVFETVKGLLGLAAGIAILTITHKDISDLAERAMNAVHMNPDSRIADWIFNATDKATPRSLMIIAIGGFAYATIRFAEAYGLWYAKVWAEWFALISGCLYLPLEIFELLKHANWFKWSVLVINLIVVIYIALIRMESHRARVREERMQLRDSG
jgi:uncharacterized membrane protein (DUF2068 family)